MNDDSVTRLAEKICDALELHYSHTPQIESLLREAMDQVRKEQHDFEMELTRPFVLKAYTRAAEVARNLLPEGYSNVAAAIERLRSSEAIEKLKEEK